MRISSELLKLLVCPVSNGALEYDTDNNELVSKAAGLAYPVYDGMPVLLPEKARRINSEGYVYGSRVRTTENDENLKKVVASKLHEQEVA